MELCHCRYCKAIFYSTLRKTCCEKCQHIDNERFETIRDYLELYPHSNALQIADGVDCEVSDIIRYIDEGRLTVIESDTPTGKSEEPMYKIKENDRRNS